MHSCLVTGVAVLDFSSISNPDFIFAFPVEPSLQQVVIDVFFVSLDVIPLLLMQLVTRLMPALKYSLFSEAGCVVISR